LELTEGLFLLGNRLRRISLREGLCGRLGRLARGQALLLGLVGQLTLKLGKIRLPGRLKRLILANLALL
jgi:hypothetical protein